MSNLLTMEHITKSYTDRNLLDDAAFSIQEGEKIGVIGVNGMGKSTLLKVVAGVEGVDSGQVIKGNQVKIGYLSQNPVFQEESSLLEAVLEGEEDVVISPAKEHEAKSMLNQLGMFDFDLKVKHLSGGQKKRAALVSVLIRPVDLLVLDEPTNHLDNAMSDWLEGYLIDCRQSVLMVTHDRYFLDRVVSRIVEVDHGQVYSYPGSYSEFVRLKEARVSSELATERKRKSILRTELEWLQRGARARSTKQKAHIQRIEDMQSIRGPQEEKQVEMSSVSSRMGKKTIEVNNISKGYDGKQLFTDFEYIFLKNDRIGIIGPNGCGKSTLIKVIQGMIPPDSGNIEMGPTIKIGYFSQENEYMDESLRVIDYIRNVAEYIETRDGKITAAKMLERFLFEGSLQYSIISKLSGGEKRRLYLLRILMDAPNVLILDEPTNDLDIQTLTILEDYLDEFDGIVITVSHDRYFLDRIVRRIFAFEQERLVQYEGGYSDYLTASEMKQDKGAGEEKGIGVSKGQETETEKVKTVKVKEKKLKFTYKEEREYEVIDEEIAALEEQLETYDRQILAAASDYGKLNALTQDKENVQLRLDEKMERWVYLTDLAERIEQERG